MVIKDFFLILQSAIGVNVRLTHCLSHDEWEEMFDLAKKQALLGLAFEGVKKLPKEQWPQGDIVLKWTMATEQVKRQNLQTTNVCLRLNDIFAKEGFDTCILKGQANHVYYDGLIDGVSLGMLRVCGDVDAWIWPKEKILHPVKSIIDYCQRRNILLSLCHLHAEVKPINGVPIEIHFRPSFLNAPWRNRNFQRVFKAAVFDNAKIDDVGVVKKLRVDYDLVFQMNHIYRHLLDEGVGLRQVFDFYVLLKDYNKERIVSKELMGKEEIMKIISSCGMKRFATALMYVLKDLFHVGNDELICGISEKDGLFLLYEIVMAGNFGHYDKRMNSIEVRKGKLSFQLQRASRRFLRNLRFLSSYPEEVICEPFARIAHFLWRKLRLYRY